MAHYFQRSLSVASPTVLVTAHMRRALSFSVRKGSRMLADYVEHRLSLFFPYNS